MTHFIGYIFSKSDSGFIVEHKFKDNMDLNNPPQKGDWVNTFYDEKVRFENITGILNDEGSISFLKDNQLTAFTQDDLIKRIFELTSDFCNMAKATNCVDLLEKRDPKNYPESSYEYVFEALKKINHPVQEVDTSFNETEYKNIVNELYMLSLQSNTLDKSTSPYHFIVKMISGVNTLLALNDHITVDVSSKLVETYQDDVNETEHLYYSGASSTIRDLYFSSHHYVPAKKIDNKFKSNYRP